MRIKREKIRFPNVQEMGLWMILSKWTTRRINVKYPQATCANHSTYHHAGEKSKKSNKTLNKIIYANECAEILVHHTGFSKNLKAFLSLSLSKTSARNLLFKTVPVFK